MKRYLRNCTALLLAVVSLLWLGGKVYKQTTTYRNLERTEETEKYQDLLVKYIEKAVAYSDRGEMTIYVNPTDADKKAYLEEKTGFTLSISKEDFIGGIRAVIPERNILVDYAFKGALEREYQKFAFGGGMGSGR